MTRKILYAAVLIALTAAYNFAQTPSPTPTPQDVQLGSPLSNIKVLNLPDSPTLETILTEAEKRIVAYRENFANLLAEETKTFEKYDKKGKLDDTRRVEANFLVYQSAKNPSSVSEYRNVTRVDGKSVGDNEKRAEDFFEKVLKSTTAERELERISEENSRYDKDLFVNGITLNQAVFLAANLRPAFEFKIAGREMIEGREMFLVAYRQTSKSRYILINEDEKSYRLFLESDANAPAAAKELNGRFRGQMWIDAETFDVWRERRELTVQPNGAGVPFVVLETDFDYQRSEGIGITPRRIVLTDYELKRKDGELRLIKETRATFEYTKFTKSDVEVKSGEVKSLNVEK